MLKTETNTLAMAKRILRAARTHLSYEIGARSRRDVCRRLTVCFEHGQHWITDNDTGAQWSVVDAEGGLSVDGFDFERVTQGEEE